ncbi:hypothetical protein OEZ85_003028 [Tetradesmus obliquus]|uniref:Uncharacterized protein n=1 Tax=Tetradesmus obliquus TaxID=3088 RepID=A0ABY8U079_TETOB|nr:hypothetical protein OEZ85_003028 [Tetradesmus obliquus]
MAIANRLGQLLSAGGISYNIRCGEHRVHMYDGRDSCGPLPNVDLVFQSFKGRDLVRPDSRAMAGSPEAQQVVKYIKRLRVHFTNLSEPNSFMVELLALQLQEQRQFGDGLPAGEDGFEMLLIAALKAIAGLEGAAGLAQALVDAKVDSKEWRDAAKFVLRQGVFNRWLIV